MSARRIVSRDWISGGADSDVDHPELVSAELTHVDTGIGIAYRNGHIVIAEHVAVDSLPNALELLREDA